MVAKIEAVLEHRRMLVETRTLVLHFVQDQLAKLQAELRDQLGSHGRVESRWARLATLDIGPVAVSTTAGAYRLSW